VVLPKGVPYRRPVKLEVVRGVLPEEEQSTSRIVFRLSATADPARPEVASIPLALRLLGQLQAMATSSISSTGFSESSTRVSERLH
jgi:hypothetical protein